MLNLEKLKRYKSYGGDIDHFARIWGNNANDIISEEDFFVITQLIQNLILLRNNLASEDFKNEIETKMTDQFGSEYSNCEHFIKEMVEWEIKKMQSLF